MEKDTMLAAGRTCTLYKSERPECLLIQPTDEHDREVLDQEVETIRSLARRPFTLVAFQIKDWQRELTPWSAPAVFGKTPFGDGAPGTLVFIEGKLMAQLKRAGLYHKDTMPCLLGGYSLAGLFALWAAYQSPVFNGIAAVSPSVWYPRWMEYALAHRPFAPAVYLSLGDKEEKTRNVVMAQVGNNIRRQHDLLTAQAVNTTLEWNVGNHFQHPDERTAKGFAWLMNHQY